MLMRLVVVIIPATGGGGMVLIVVVVVMAPMMIVLSGGCRVQQPLAVKTERQQVIATSCTVFARSTFRHGLLYRNRIKGSSGSRSAPLSKSQSRTKGVEIAGKIAQFERAARND